MIVINRGKRTEIEINIKEQKQCNLLELLQDKGIYVSNSCRGNGTCGKCKVAIKSDKVLATETDRKFLSDKELEQGVRLACKVKLQELCEDNESKIVVEIIDELEDEIVVEGIHINDDDTDFKDNNSTMNYIDDTVKQTYFIAIDIGTTTIAMALVDADTGEVCDTYTAVNHQRIFGADVISRIAASNEGKGKELKRIIEDDLWKGICYFLQESDNLKRKTEIPMGREQELQLKGIVIAANTTMMHLLRGYSCASLGKYPFFSDCLEQTEEKLQDVIGHGNQKVPQWVYEVPVLLMPGISAFVGSDIVAGMLVCNGFEEDELSLFLDLGTNGEMMLGNEERLLAASVAAGPAFEGGNITCGMASVPGSISQIKIVNRKAVVGTIGKKMPPVGICGSGLISIIASLLREKMIDVHGNLAAPYSQDGFALWTFSNGNKIALYQEDIRQFQMAKSAIRSGIDILLKEYGCQAQDIKKVYIAGGFGTHLVADDVIVCGLLPREWEGKIEFLGNTALKGAIEVGKNNYGNEKNLSLGKKKRNVLEKSKTVSLATSEEFQQVYIKNMNFD